MKDCTRSVRDGRHTTSLQIVISTLIGRRLMTLAFRASRSAGSIDSRPAEDSDCAGKPDDGAGVHATRSGAEKRTVKNL